MSLSTSPKFLTVFHIKSQFGGPWFPQCPGSVHGGVVGVKGHCLLQMICCWFIQRIDLREKNTGHTHVLEENRWFPVDVPFRQSIDSYLLDRGYYIYICLCNISIYSCACINNVRVYYGLMNIHKWWRKNKTASILYTFIHIYIMYIIISYHIASLEHMLQTWYCIISFQQFPAVSRQVPIKSPFISPYYIPQWD